MVEPSTQWLGSGLGHSGSTWKRGACAPAALTEAAGEEDWQPATRRVETMTGSSQTERWRMARIFTALTSARATADQFHQRRAISASGIRRDVAILREVSHNRRGSFAEPVGILRRTELQLGYTEPAWQAPVLEVDLRPDQGVNREATAASAVCAAPARMCRRASRAERRAAHDAG